MIPKKTFRSQNGVVYTPKLVADSLVQYVMGLRDLGYRTILEPSAGDGSFVSALEKHRSKNSSLTAIDKSRVAYKKLFADFPKVDVLESDFIGFANSKPAQKYDLVIGNPPYVRRANMTARGKKSLEKLDQKNQMYSGSLVNLWAAFLKAAVDVASEDAVIAFVLPYEMLNNSYGIKIQNWISEEIGSLDIFISKLRAFSGIDQDAVIAVIDLASLGNGIKIRYVDDFLDLETSKDKAVTKVISANCALSRHSFLLDHDTISLLKSLSYNLPKAESFCTNSTGIVTGANKYFILSTDDIEKHDLEEYAKPIVQKASDMPDTIMIKSDVGMPAYTRYVLDFDGLDTYDLSAAAVAYIRKIANDGVATRYKCRNRDPWYQVPILDSAPLYFFKRSHQKLKLIRNHTDIRITDTAYRVYPKVNVNADSLQSSFYNSLTLLFGEVEGRFYGGGVLEVTPNEFRKIPVIYEALCKKSNGEYQKRLEKYISSPDRIFQFGDDALKRKMQMTTDELKLVQNAYLALQDHRLRHGKALISKALN